MTQEEYIKSLSLEMKVCYYLAPWNRNMDIEFKKYEDFENVFWCWYGSEDCTEEEARKELRDEFSKLYLFILNYIV